jgi:hypothetical protein
VRDLNAHPEPRSTFSPPRELHGQPLERHGEGFRLGWYGTECIYEGNFPLCYTLNRIQTTCHYGSYMIDTEPWKISECSEYIKEVRADILEDMEDYEADEVDELLEHCGKLRVWKEWLWR